MAQQVVPGPETAGRNARYSRAALTRACAAKALRDLYGMSLPAIRQELLTADSTRIEAYAAMAGPGAGVVSEQGVSTRVAKENTPPPSGASAADYLRRLRSAGVFGRAKPRIDSSSPFYLAVAASPEPSETAALSNLERLVEALQRISGPRPSRRKSKGEVRLHIPITPDLELTIRGDHSAEEIARFEQIADLLRALLTGGFEHD